MESVISDIREFIDEGFERELFDSSISYLDNKSDPLRINSFAYSARELLRNVLSRLSPDEEVINCDLWFKIETDNGKPTRKQRIQYAIHGGLPPEFVINELSFDISDYWKEIKDSIDHLNKYTHVNEETFNAPESVCNKVFTDVLSSLHTIFMQVKECRDEIKRILYGYIDTELIDSFVSNSFSELDILSSGTCIDYTTLEDYEIVKITPTYIEIEGNGELSATLNWGRGDDAASGSHECDYEFSCRAPVHEPKKLTIQADDIAIDNSGWFE